MAAQSQARPASALPLARVRSWFPVLAVFAAALVLRFFIAQNSDVSWGITVGEKLLRGARLYVDVIEVNPPATIYLYLPAVILAQTLSLKPEWVVNALVFFAAALSLWFSGGLLRESRLLPRVDERWLAAIAAAALLILPSRIFAEREHIALIAALPALAVFIRMAEGRRVPNRAQFVAGIGGGLVAIIKPYLALGVIFAALASAFAAKSPRPLFALQNWIAAALCAAYAFWVWRLFPAFFTDILPLVGAIYLPLKLPLFELIFETGFPLWLIGVAGTLWLARGKILTPVYAVPLAASCGFALAFLLQGKAWPYQSYPAISLSCFALCLAFLDRFHAAGAIRSETKRVFAALFTALVAGGAFLWFMLAIDVSSLAGPVRALKAHPKIIALSDDNGIGHPLVREVEGTWAGRTLSLWATSHVRILRTRDKLDPATDAKLAAYAEADRRRFTEDVLRERPDIILLDRITRFDWLAWANADPKTRAALAAYRPRGTYDQVTILLRER
jgi:hypothetical protein